MKQKADTLNKIVPLTSQQNNQISISLQMKTAEDWLWDRGKNAWFEVLDSILLQKKMSYKLRIAWSAMQ